MNEKNERLGITYGFASSLVRCILQRGLYNLLDRAQANKFLLREALGD
ncbi:MAG: hypothetical protein JSV82_09620 [Planctomycetota bacterium]|nr:MAG: hypothetical protein JSV82_09620 [Planctomycetota bacterium]